MESLEPKKLALLRILQIYRKYSDYSHPLKQEKIADILKKEYDIVIERKAISRNVALLKSAGFEIESTRDGSYLAEREISDPELRVLIDGVLSSKYISAKYSKDLIEKLCNLSSTYFRSHMKHIHSLSDWDKTENPALFLNIEIIDEAIESKKKVSFDYNKYGTDKKLHKTHPHTVSPYQLILHNQRYYLMGWEEYWKSMIYYRLDRITNISLTDEKLTPITSLKGYRNGINYKDLSTAMPYMYTDAPETVEFIADESVIDQVIDWFGKDVRISKCGEGRIRVSLRVSPMAMEHWAMQYAGYVTVTSPQSLADSINKRLKKAVKDYK